MQKKLISAVKFIFFLGLGVFLVWWSINKLNEKDYLEFINSLKNANYYLLIPVFFILSASHVSRTLRWKILMKSMGYNPGFSNTFCAVMVGYLANFAFPRLGEVLKCTILGKYEKVPADKLVGTILVERAVDLISFFIVILISLLTQAEIVGFYAKDAFNKYFLSQDKGVTVIKVSTILFLLVASFFLLKYGFKKYGHLIFIKKLKNIFDGIITGLLSVKKLKNKWQFILHSVFIWVCYLLGTYIGFYAIKETATLPVLASFPILVFGGLATMITPGGIGLYPVFIMEAMRLYNIPESYGSANGWLQWSAQFVIILVVGFICLLLLPYINKSKNEIGTIDTP
jgi:glycosyltransferase 2 family protein